MNFPEEKEETHPERPRDLTVRRGSLHDDHDWDMMQYFLSRPVEERFAAMEQLRIAMHGEDYETKLRLPRTALKVQRRDR